MDGGTLHGSQPLALYPFWLVYDRSASSSDSRPLLWHQERGRLAMALSRRLKFLLFSLFISTYVHGKDEYACFLAKTAPPIKLTIEGNRLTMQYPASGIIPARIQKLEMLNLNTPRDQHIESIDRCSLIQNTYTLGIMSEDYCWRSHLDSFG